MKTLRYFLTLLLPLALSCSSPTVPTASSSVDELPSIYPDYIDVTIPCNIAPLTFEIKEQGDEYVTRISSGGYEIVEGGNIVAPSIEKWQSLIAAANVTRSRSRFLSRSKVYGMPINPLAVRFLPIR